MGIDNLHIGNNAHDLGKIRQVRTWCVGNPNLDNDLHIASYYLAASSLKQPPLGDESLAYSILVSEFNNFNETYWVPQSEVDRVAQEVIARMQQNSAWFADILKSIYHTSDNLEIFARQSLKYNLTTLNNIELKTLYDKHVQVHSELYNFARIPETLDRGDELFTHFLKKHITSLWKQKFKITPNNIELNQTFLSLIAPTESSILEKADLFLLEIAAAIRGDNDKSHGMSQAELFERDIREIWLYLKPFYREQINQFIAQYGYSFYHGYANRTLPSELDVIFKLKHYVLGNPENESQKIIDRHKTNEVKRDALFTYFDIDSSWQKLFLFYPQIGLAKMYRRNAQLINFFLLDKLLYEIGLRFQLPEAVVRSALPCELSVLLSTEHPMSDVMHLRLRHRQVQHLLYYIQGMQHGLIDNPNLIAQIVSQITAHEKVTTDTTVLRGSPVYPGDVQGEAIVALRPSDLLGISHRNTKKLVVVSGSTDPDLIYAIKEYQAQNEEDIVAILTETGGITCHAAITARELEIPTVVGLHGLLKTVNTGDQLLVNANEGTVTIVERLSKNTDTLPLPSVFQISGLRADQLGTKAYNLSILYQNQNELGYRVTPAIFLDPLDVTSEIRRAQAYQSDRKYRLDSAIEYKVVRSCEILGWNNNCRLIIRSSTTTEDSAITAAAGYYDSIPNINIERIIDELTKYIFINSRVTNNGGGYQGSIIIQEEVKPDFSGVMFTQNPNVNNGLGHDVIIIEAIPGGNQQVTNGSITPLLISVERQCVNSGGVRVVRNRDEWLPEPKIISLLGQVGLRIEGLFAEQFKSQPADIEWGVYKGEIYVFQARSLVNR